MAIEKIGVLLGVSVLVNREDRTVIIAAGSEDHFPPLKFSIDHPYIQGTKIERDARDWLDRGEDQ